MNRFVIGDIHGRIEALKEVLEDCSFNYEEDKLIILGDVVDGGYNTYEVVEELLKIKNKVFVLGNHDEFFMNHIKSGWAEDIWIHQGGANTLKSYGGKKIPDEDKISISQDHYIIDATNVNIPVTHQEFFNSGVYYHIEDNMLFVHAGYNVYTGVQKSRKHDLVWDRTIIKKAQTQKLPKYKKVFIGHTTTQLYNSDEPIKYNNLWMVDCGAGWSGKLCIMDIDTEEHWLSKRQTPALD